MKKKPRTSSLVPSPSTPADDYRAQVSMAYAYTQSATAEWFKTIIAFGALLDEVSAFLGASRGGNHDGEGLKSWLAKNCPEVNINTAYGYKAMAAKCAKMLGGGTQAIAALQGREVIKAPGSDETVEIDGEILAKREELFAEADSRRKLEQMYLDFIGGETKAKGGRPKAAAKPIVKLSRRDEARKIWSDVLIVLSKTSVRDSIPLLPENETSICLDELKGLVAALKDHLQEF